MNAQMKLHELYAEKARAKAAGDHARVSELDRLIEARIHALGQDQ
jgi:hypothetical protein